VPAEAIERRLSRPKRSQEGGLAPAADQKDLKSGGKPPSQL